MGKIKKIISEVYQIVMLGAGSAAMFSGYSHRDSLFALIGVFFVGTAIAVRIAGTLETINETLEDIACSLDDCE